MVLPSALPSKTCLVDNAWVCGEYLRSRRDEILSALGQHVLLTAVSLAIGVVIAIPLGLLAHRSRPVRAFILGASTAVYTVPSLALFALLLPLTGITATTVVIGLVLYSMTVLVRAVVDGLESVPPDVVDAATGMGLGARRMLWGIQVPLALPTFFAGLRVAAVSTVALATIGFVVGYGGLGNLISEGLNSYFKAQVLTASVLCVALAIAADVLVVGLQRVAMPWRRHGA